MNAQPLITIGLVTDLHYSTTPYGNRFCDESLTKLQQSVETFCERRPDVMIHLGDAIDVSEPIEQELTCIREVRETLDKVPGEVHTLLGNHDVSELTKAQFLEAWGASQSYYSFDCRGVHMVMLDSNFNSDGSDFAPDAFEWYDAWIGEKQLAWLKSDLEAAGSTPTLVFCHANLDHRVRDNGELNSHIVKDAAAVREVLEASGCVKAVIQGHCHSGFQATIKGIPYIVLRAMVEGSGLEQNAYAILSLMNDDTVVLEGFGQQESMRVERELSPNALRAD